MSWYTENIESQNGTTFGAEPTVKGVLIKTAPTTGLLVVGGLIAATMGALGYKFLSLMGKEHARLTPRRRY